MRDRYSVMVECDNCRSENIVNVPLGMTVVKHLEEAKIPCSVCMCLTLNPHVVSTLGLG